MVKIKLYLPDIVKIVNSAIVITKDVFILLILLDLYVGSYNILLYVLQIIILGTADGCASNNVEISVK